VSESNELQERVLLAIIEKTVLFAWIAEAEEKVVFAITAIKVDSNLIFASSILASSREQRLL
jgi:hypothetical protein